MAAVTEKRRNKRGPKKEKQNTTPPSKRRVRTGCLTCRRKHKKCDENRNPKCEFCTIKGFECIWPEDIKKNVFVNNSFKDFQPNQTSHFTQGLPEYLLKQVNSELNLQYLNNKFNFTNTSNLTQQQIRHSIDYSELPANLNNNNNNNINLNSENLLTYSNSNSNSSTNIFNSFVSSLSSSYLTPQQQQQQQQQFKRRKTDLGFYNTNSLTDSLSSSSSPFFGNNSTFDGTNKKNESSSMLNNIALKKDDTSIAPSNLEFMLLEQPVPFDGTDNNLINSKATSPSSLMKMNNDLDPISLGLGMFQPSTSSVAGNQNSRSSAASSVSSDLSLKKDFDDFEHRDSIMSVDDFAEINEDENLKNKISSYSFPQYYDLNDSLTDFISLITATKKSEELPNNENTFEFFTDKSSLEEPVLSDDEMVLLMSIYTTKISLVLKGFNDDDSNDSNFNVFSSSLPLLCDMDQSSINNNEDIAATTTTTTTTTSSTPGELDNVKLALKYSMLALSSRYLEIVDKNYSYDKTLSLYNYSLHHLTSMKNNITCSTTNGSSDNESLITIITCFMLSIFELLSSKAEDQSRRLNNINTLFQAFNIDGSNTNIIKRNLFWSFVKFDTGYCSIAELNSTILSPKNWFTQQESSSPSSDMKQILHLVAKVIELSSSLNLTDETNEFNNNWKSIWQDLLHWKLNKSDSMKSIMVQKSSSSSGNTPTCNNNNNTNTSASFPKILYPSSNASTTNQLYHMCCILMLQNKPRIFKMQKATPVSPTNSLSDSPNSTPGNTDVFNCQSKSQIWHAKQIIGINLLSIPNVKSKKSISQISFVRDDELLSFNPLILQCLLVAGRLITSPNEHKVILNLLYNLERATGFSNLIGSKKRQLVEFWNSEC